MAYKHYFLIFIIAVFSSNFVKCAEFVPVYMWGSNKLSEHVPALHKISQESFKDTLLEYLKEDPYVIVFAERTLSPEDFAQHDQKGEIAFPNILDLKKQKNYVTYKPYVQNPIKAIKQLNKEVTELSIESLLSSSNVPKNNILIIDLNDARDDEPRFHMLKRHDSDIVSIYKDILEQRNNVLAIYTAYHTAWVAPEEITHSKSRNLLQATETPSAPDTSIFFNADNISLYLTSPGQLVQYENKEIVKTVNITDEFTLSATTAEPNISVSLNGPELTFSLHITQKAGYWYIQSLSIKESSSDEIPLVGGSKDYYAPSGFSYHCANFILKDKSGNFSLNLPGFQIQPVSNKSFGDAYDCVGFTSVPIWSGLFVTIILLLIITFGLTMMMDIKTMDRFDDPKGKTITVNASE